MIQSPLAYRAEPGSRLLHHGKPRMGIKALGMDTFRGATRSDNPHEGELFTRQRVEPLFKMQ